MRDGYLISATRAMRSELPMQPGAKDRHRAAGLVESVVVNELVIQGCVNVFPNLAIVIRFHGFFPAVAQIAVASENAQASRLKIFLLLLGDAVHHPRQAKGVPGTTPGFSV